MREADQLKAALLRALADDDGDTDTSPQAALSQILHEIDGIVLPRDVQLDNGRGEVLTLTVKGRRLVRVHAPVPRTLGALPGVADKELSGHEDQMAGLAHLLAGFAAHTTSLSVSITEPKHPETLTEIGLTVDQLAAAISDAGYSISSDGDGTIDTLSEIARAHDLTWVLFEGDKLTGSGGDKAQLRPCIEAALPHIEKTERPTGDQAATWIFGTADAPRTAITIKGRSCLIANLPTTLTQAWINACSGQPEA